LPLPQKLPISFYDADPRTATAKKIGSTFYLPDSVAGNCCSKLINYKLNVGRNGLNTLYAVFNDSGNTSPLKFPNASFLEKDYSNNIAFIQNFDYKVSATPSISVLEPGDTLQLNAIAGPGTTTSYTWNLPGDLSCITCQSPVLIAGSSTLKNVVATSNKGCTDTAYVDIKVPPYNDYRIAINDAQCAAADSMYVNFTLYNDFKRAVLPASLSVSFYNGNPAFGNAVLLNPVFSLKDTINAKEYTFNTFIKGIGAGNIYAVVNDSGKALPVTFSNIRLVEKNYSNNISLFSYKPEEVFIQPSDTTVFRKELVPLTIISPVYDPTSTRWSTVNGSTLSCADCPATIVKALDSSVVRVQTKNRFGCLLNGTAAINIFPPDMQVQITDTKCFSDNTALVTFSICMNNNYDSVFANIPVSFYDGNPESGTSRLLQPVFYTPLKQVGSCYTYTAKVTSPSTNNLYAVVNDKGTRIAAQASTVYKETNYTNNLSQAIYTPFRVSIIPSDTLIQRSTSITLTPRAEGGTLTQYLWKPGPFISCTNCATPIVTPQYTMQYQLWAKNENFCTDTASAIVRTHIAKEVFIPDAFTPNNDKLNDVLYVLSDPLATLINDFAIFNRLGQKVFQVQNVVPNNPAFGWNGKINGRDAPAGTYVYFVTMGFNDGRRQTYKGTIVLIR
jgi:gliding motility-associated-like protein